MLSFKYADAGAEFGCPIKPGSLTAPRTIDLPHSLPALRRPVDDPALKKFFSALQQQEKAHAKTVGSMLAAFDYKGK